MKTTDDLLDLLKDGKYHSFFKLLRKTGLSKTKLQSLLYFLRDYDFIMFGSSHPRSVRMSDPMQRFWQKIKEIEQSKK